MKWDALVKGKVVDADGYKPATDYDGELHFPEAQADWGMVDEVREQGTGRTVQLHRPINIEAEVSLRVVMYGQ